MVSLGYGPDGKRIRRKVFGRTKQEVRDRLKALHQEMDAGLRSSKTHTVREAVDDWLREGLDCASERTRTLYEGLLEPLLEVIGARPLRLLSAGEVRSGLGKLSDRYSTRSLQITRNSLERAIRHAESNDLAGRNVAALVKAPQGGRISDLHAVYGGLGSGRLVIAGSPGSGKSGAAVLLVLAALKHREQVSVAERSQVPVMFTLHGWDPGTQRVQSWLAARLQQTYPLLAGKSGARKAAGL